MSTKYIGAHVSIAGGTDQAPGRAVEIGAEAFAMFTKNQRRWNAKPISDDEAERFRANREEAGIEAKHVLPHDGYLINLANPDDGKRKKSLDALLDEARRVRQLGLELLNFHPGQHLDGMTDEEACEVIARGMDEVFSRVEGITLVIETTAGQGSSVGYTFEHLARIIDASAYPGRIGVCIDTCHIFAAGYDLRDEKAYRKTMDRFEEVLGFSLLKGVHLNDAKSDFASRVDRHAPLGKGNIGEEAFRLLMADERLDDIPLILETPEPELWPEEISFLYSLAE